MSVFEAIILGIVQGLTEFLPVSSSGHLVLLQTVFGIQEPMLLFDTMVHVGTLAAVFTVLRRDIWSILKKPLQPITGYLVIATIPAVIGALVFKDLIENAFESGLFLGFAFLLTALILANSEIIARHSLKVKNQENMNWLDALFIGVLQAVAIVPGVSRSGSTLSGAIVRKLDRDFAARFSFLLSIPAILGALVLQIKDLSDGKTGGTFNAAMLIGTLSAAAVGFFSIKLMLHIVKNRSLLGFAAYTAVLGLLVLCDQNSTHFFF
ncbi:undecaprenyl-diphosphate phosphatase [Breznakiellaceae bacterium SP9]